MAYPSTIGATASFLGYTLGDGALGQMGFEHGSSLYFIGMQSGDFVTPPGTGDFKLHCFTSADSGNTWTELDAANAPTPDPAPITGADYDKTYTSMVDGNTVYIIAPAGSTGGGVHPFVSSGTKLYTFNLTSGLWAINGTTPSADIPLQDLPSGGAATRQYALQLVKRGTGDYILFFSGTHEVVSAIPYGRLFYTTFDGSGYGAPVLIPGQTGVAKTSYPVGAVIDAASRTHFLFTAAPFFNNLYHVGMTGGGSFGTTQTVSAFADANIAGVISVPTVYTIAAVEYIAVAGLFWNNPANDTECVSVYMATTALDPVWSHNDLLLANYGDQTANLVPFSWYSGYSFQHLFGIFETAGTVAVIWAYGPVPPSDFGNPSPNFYSMTTTVADLSSGWTAPAVLLTATAESFTWSPLQVQAFPVTGGIGVLALSVENGLSNAELAQFTLMATATPPSVICDSPPNGTTGLPYSHAFPASSGTPPYTWSITAGALPTGVTLNASTGVASGTPTVAALFSFTVGVTDSAAQTASVDCSITVSTGVTIGCASPPAVYVGVPYYHQFPATGGTPPYTFSIASGALPTGLTLDTATGIVSGVPTVSGTFTFTVRVVGS